MTKHQRMAKRHADRRHYHQSKTAMVAKMVARTPYFSNLAEETKAMSRLLAKLPPAYFVHMQAHGYMNFTPMTTLWDDIKIEESK